MMMMIWKFFFSYKQRMFKLNFYLIRFFFTDNNRLCTR